MKLKKYAFIVLISTLFVSGAAGNNLSENNFFRGVGIIPLYAGGDYTSGSSGDCPAGQTKDANGNCTSDSGSGSTNTSAAAVVTSQSPIQVTSGNSISGLPNGSINGASGIICKGVGESIAVTATVAAGGLSKVMTFFVKCLSCGNTITEAQFGEDCDDGNKIDTDGCNNDCRRCGNGIEESGEECDDGNQVECSADRSDTCSNTCKRMTYDLGECIKDCSVDGETKLQCNAFTKATETSCLCTDCAELDCLT